MSRSEQPSPSSKNSSFIWVISGIVWAFLAAMFFLMYGSGSKPEPFYLMGTAIFEIVAFGAAAYLCIRNSLSTNNVSGKSVWIGIGMGMLLYCIGSTLYAYWEVILDMSPDVSIGDLFYVASYLFLIYGMLRAVLERKLNLDLKQWLVVLSVGVVGVALALYVKGLDVASKSTVQWSLMPPAIAQTTPAPKATPAPLKATPKASPSITPSAASSVTPTPAIPTKAAPQVAPQEPVVNHPAWAVSLDKMLKPLKEPLNWFYVVADSCLLTIATALLVAFWGGRFSQAWRMIAFATFSLYVADVWVKYDTGRLGDAYTSGRLPEVFFIFAGVLFAIAAVLEYDLSKSRRSGGRRRNAA